MNTNLFAGIAVIVEQEQRIEYRVSEPATESLVTFHQNNWFVLTVQQHCCTFQA